MRQPATCRDRGEQERPQLVAEPDAADDGSSPAGQRTLCPNRTGERSERTEAATIHAQQVCDETGVAAVAPAP